LKVKENKLAAPCGLYCGACIDYLIYKSCHGCGCGCGVCDSSGHHERCNIYKCCVEQRNYKACSECEEFPCSALIMFCHSPVWLHHLPVIENLRRRKAVGPVKWVEEQIDTWSNEWYLRRWLWLQKECEKRLEKSLEESKDILSEKKSFTQDKERNFQFAREG
jgi:hypothetical protein